MTDEKIEKPVGREKNIAPETIACEICLKEVPASVGQTFEGDDYVLNFCGIECYDKWNQQNKNDETETKK